MFARNREHFFGRSLGFLFSETIFGSVCNNFKMLLVPDFLNIVERLEKVIKLLEMKNVDKDYSGVGSKRCFYARKKNEKIIIVLFG